MVRFKDEDTIKEEQTARSVNRCYKFVTFDSIKKGFAERYIEAFATFLGATAFQFTLLVSIPQFIGGIVQLFTTNILKFFRSKKKMAFFLSIFQSITWIAILSLLFIKSDFRVWIYVSLVTLHFVLSLLHSPLWNSWVMDLVSDEKRGKYLSLQSKIYNFVTFISFLAGGFILSRAVSTGDNVDITFSALFGVAIISNLIGAYHLKRIHEPEYAFIRPKTSLSRFVKGMRTGSQGRIIMFISLMSFSVALGSPFYTPYVLRSLEFSYLQFAFIFMLPYLMRVFFAKRIGRAVDRYGPKKILRIVSFLIAFTPALWLISPSFWWILLVQMYSGICYGIYEVVAVAFFINETDSKNRISLFTYYNFFNGVFILLGALSTNLLMMFGPFDNPFMNAFMWSAIFRFLVALIRFPSAVREKDRYVPSSYTTISKEVFAMDAPRELLSSMVNAKELIATKILNKDDIIARVGDHEYVKIRKKQNLVTNYPEHYKKFPPKAPYEERVPEHMIYMCEGCNSEFRRNTKSKVTLKCPYCSNEDVYPLREDFSVKSYDSKRIPKR